MEADVPPVLWDIGEAAEAIQEVLRREEDAFARRDLDAIVGCYDPNFVEMEGHIQTRLPDMVWYWQKSMAVTAWLTHQITADEFVREGP